MESITDNLKQSFFVMFCGNAAGEFVPPMVVYKAKIFTKIGPEMDHVVRRLIRFNSLISMVLYFLDYMVYGIYGSTASGWSDLNTCERWFHEVFPHLLQLPGKKVIIRDNLGCHFSETVIVSCRDNISFVCLIPNSTHLCQPLDIAVLKPSKALWFTVVSQWRLIGTIPEEVFPSLLRQVANELIKDGKNIVSGKTLHCYIILLFGCSLIL